MYSVEAVKIEVFLLHYMSNRNREALSKCWNRYYLKHLHEHFEVC